MTSPAARPTRSGLGSYESAVVSKLTGHRPPDLVWIQHSGKQYEEFQVVCPVRLLDKKQADRIRSHLDLYTPESLDAARKEVIETLGQMRPPPSAAFVESVRKAFDEN